MIRDVVFCFLVSGFVFVVGQDYPAIRKFPLWAQIAYAAVVGVSVLVVLRILHFIFGP